MSVYVMFRFDINLCCDGDDEDRCFHFNPRFYQGETVRNSKLGGGYGDEETDGGFPFHANKVHKIGIQAQEDYYKVYQGAHYVDSSGGWNFGFVCFFLIHRL